MCIRDSAWTAYFAEEKNNRIVDHLLNELEIEIEQVDTSQQRFAGMTFVITGSVEHFANRKALQQEIENRGGKATGSVTSKTTYLINNDSASNSSKNKKAKELGGDVYKRQGHREGTEGYLHRKNLPVHRNNLLPAG